MEIRQCTQFLLLLLQLVSCLPHQFHIHLHGCIVTERLDGQEGVGICLCHKVDGKLFRRYTKAGLRELLTEFQFADDVALLAFTMQDGCREDHLDLHGCS